MERLIEIITRQQQGHENEPLFMVGEQLKDIASREPASAELLEQDLEVEAMSLRAAAAELQKYSDKNRGSAKCFCITPLVAEEILRKFYGLPSPDKAGAQSTQNSTDFIDLSNFL
jgi:hypothetical protein